jgi:hypothetical protein
VLLVGAFSRNGREDRVKDCELDGVRLIRGG